MPIIGRPIQLYGKKRLYILQGTTEAQGTEWVLRSIRYNTSSTQHDLTKDASGDYIVLTSARNTINNQKSGAFCSANDNKIDLAAYSKVVLEFDMTVTAQTETQVTRSAWATLFAWDNSMFASNTYQATGGMTYHEDSQEVTATTAGTTVTNQKIEIDITTATTLVVAIGLNQRGNGVDAVLTIKRLYAE